MKPQGLLIVVSAPSGGGKTTICEQLLRHDRRLGRSVSATTRLRRGREREGREYFFVTPAEFRRRIKQRRFIEWARVHDHYYGTPRQAVERQLAAGRDVVLVIDVQGGLAVKRQYPRAVLIFVMPPSRQVLAARLRGRGTDTQATIRRRLQNARWEMDLAKRYDYQVVNRRLQDAVEQIQAIITAARLRVGIENKTKRRPKTSGRGFLALRAKDL